MKNILITGTAGFIGFHLVNLLKADYNIVGLDNINDYYDVNLKYSRLEQAGIEKNKIEYGKLILSNNNSNYRFIQLELNDTEKIKELFLQEKFDYVVNLAAQAGVRYSLINPYAYTESNITGFLNILEGCRTNNVKHLVYASTSSVYGLNSTMPLSEHESTEHPITLYAATKKANEMMAHSYSHLFRLPVTGLRFFTVYGPWGRPDMALFLFTKAILANEPLNVFNNGEMVRDFTYVHDIAAAIEAILKKPATPNISWNGKTHDTASSSAPYKIVNIGNSTPIKLMDYIKAIEKNLNKRAVYNMLPMQLGDVAATKADITELEHYYGYTPKVKIEEGIKNFIDWYKDYFKII